MREIFRDVNKAETSQRRHFSKDEIPEANNWVGFSLDFGSGFGQWTTWTMKSGTAGRALLSIQTGSFPIVGDQSGVGQACVGRCEYVT